MVILRLTVGCTTRIVRSSRLGLGDRHVMTTIVSDFAQKLYDDDDGRVPNPQARRLFEFLGSIIEAVTAGYEVSAPADTTVRCRRRPGRQPCPGAIVAVRETLPSGIIWGCSHCDDNGFITGFEDCEYYLGDDRQRPKGLLLRLDLDAAELNLLREFVRPSGLWSKRLLSGARTATLSSGFHLYGSKTCFDQLDRDVRAAAETAKLPSTRRRLQHLAILLEGLTAVSWSDALKGSELGLSARIDVDRWELDDAEARNVAHPESFWIPPHFVRTGLGPGTVVQLIFALEPDQPEEDEPICFERMWVQIEAAAGDLYVGRLDNQPVSTTRLRPGTPIFFGPEHIIDIWADGPEPV